MPLVQILIPDSGICTTYAVFVFKKLYILNGRFLFQKLLINSEFSINYTAAPQKNSVNILLRNDKSGGLFILRCINSLLLFFLGGERVGQT